MIQQQGNTQQQNTRLVLRSKNSATSQTSSLSSLRKHISPPKPTTNQLRSATYKPTQQVITNARSKSPNNQSRQKITPTKPNESSEYLQLGKILYQQNTVDNQFTEQLNKTQRLKEEFSPRFNMIIQDQDDLISKNANEISQYLNQREIRTLKKKEQTLEEKFNVLHPNNQNMESLWGNEYVIETSPTQQSPIQKCIDNKNDNQGFQTFSQNQTNQSSNFGGNIINKQEIKNQNFTRQDFYIGCQRPSQSLPQEENSFEKEDGLSPKIMDFIQKKQNYTLNDQNKFNADYDIIASFQNFGQQIHFLNEQKNQDEATKYQQSNGSSGVSEIMKTSQTNILDQENSPSRYSQEETIKKVDEESKSQENQQQVSQYEHSSLKYENVFEQKDSVRINENDILIKYANIFTSPDFLNSCKLSIQEFSRYRSKNDSQQHEYQTDYQQNFQHDYQQDTETRKTQEETEMIKCNDIYTEKRFSESYPNNVSQTLEKEQPSEVQQGEKLSWNFMVPCQSMIYQNPLGDMQKCHSQTISNWELLNQNRGLQTSQFELLDQYQKNYIEQYQKSQIDDVHLRVQQFWQKND